MLPNDPPVLNPLSWAALALAIVAVVAAFLAERRLRRRAEARNRAILASVFADLAILTHDGVVEACNENWSRATGTSNPFTSARVGERWIQTQLAQSVESGADLRRIHDALDVVLAGQEPEQTVEYAWQDGASWKWSHLRLRGLERVDGGAVVAHMDITARKRIEAEAQSALHELAHMNMRAGMGEVVSAVIHELTQSLTASLSNAQALKRMLAEHRLAYEDLPAILDDISDANRQASEIIGRIRALMRKDDFDMQPLDLNVIVMEVVQVMYSTAANDGVLLVADLESTLPPILADRVQLRQVTLNLVLNAIQATRGHQSVSAVVRVSTAHGNGSVSMTVDDAGPGVDEAAIPRLFEPYFTTKPNGLGLGLSISRSIAQAHGGSIRVENLPQGGARFSVALPVQ